MGEYVQDKDSKTEFDRKRNQETPPNIAATIKSLLSLQETTQWLWLSMPGNLRNHVFCVLNTFQQVDQWDTKMAQWRDYLSGQLNEPVLLGTVNQMPNNRKGMKNITQTTKYIEMQGLNNQVHK